MGPTVENDPHEENMTKDDIIMKEIKKIEKWKDEGFDTSKLERLLFEDMEEYNKEKIRTLSRSLETSHFDNNTKIENVTTPNYILEKDVITNSSTDGQISTDNPPLLDKDMASNDKTTSNGRSGDKKIIKYHGKKAKGVMIIIFSISCVLLLLASGYYFLIMKNNDKNEDLDAFFKISDLHPISGSIVELSSVMKDVRTSHTWTISPKDLIIIKGDVDEPYLEIFFTSSGTYTIIHEVKIEELSKTHTEDIKVEPLSLRIDRESIEDRSKYHIIGDMRISNVRSIIDMPEASSFKNLEMEFWSEESKPTLSTLSFSDGTFKDGFAQTYSTIIRNTEQYLSLSGTIEKYDRSKIPFTGIMETTDKTDIDLYYRSASRIRLDNHIFIDVQLQPGSSKKYSLRENFVIYPGLSQGSYDLKLDDITNDRYLSEGEMGNLLWGSSLINWKAEEVLRFHGRPCINVSLWMDKSTLDSNDLDAFSMNVYLSDGSPVSLRTIYHIKTKDDIKNPYIFNLDQVLVDIEKGTNPVIYGNIDDQHLKIINILQTKQEYITHFHDNWTYVPVYGTLISSIPSDFDAEIAVEEFSSKQTFLNFVSGLKEPYSVYSNYSEMTGAKVWKFSISEPNNQWAWNQTVIKDNPVSTGFKSRIEPVSVRLDDIRSILTISASESLFKDLIGELNPSFSRSIYGVPQPEENNFMDMTNWAITFVSDNSYPGFGTMNHGSFMKTPYSVIISSRDGRFEAALDMNTGQLCYLISRSKS
ncbi:MAG: hypothetical protein QCI82_02695 [Candidatus Thermoplasmatota archaeon]|nr:hypothetical protein [Candidatus Thermoplasmatota archaeon]